MQQQTAIDEQSCLQQTTVDKDSLPGQLRDGRLWAGSVDGDGVATFEVPGHSRKYIFFQNAGAEVYSATMPTTVGETSEASAPFLAAIECA